MVSIEVFFLSRSLSSGEQAEASIRSRRVRKRRTRSERKRPAPSPQRLAVQPRGGRSPGPAGRLSRASAPACPPGSRPGPSKGISGLPARLGGPGAMLSGGLGNAWGTRGPSRRLQPSARAGRRRRRRRPAPRRRLGSASRWDLDLHPVAAGVRGAAFPRRLARLARLAAGRSPALAGELAAGGRAGLSRLPGRPGRREAGGRLARRAGPGGGCGGRGPGREVARGRRGAGGSGARVALGASADPGRPRHFRGWGGVWVPDGLLRWWRLQLPPPVLAPASVSGGARSPHGAEEGKRQNPPGHKGPRGGGGAAGAAAQPRGKAGARVCGRWARRRRPRRLQLLGDAGVWVGGEPRRRGALAWGAGRDKDQGSLPLTGHTPACRSTSRGGGNVGNSKELMGRGTWGSAKYCRLGRGCFSQRFWARRFCSPTQLDSSRFPPSHHPLTATLTLLWFSPPSPPTFHPLLFG